MRPAALLAAMLGIVAACHPASAQLNAIFTPLPADFSPAAISKSKTLQFVLVPGAKANTVMAWGGIARGDSLRLSAALTAARPVAELQLFSPGGSLSEGMLMGRLVRTRALATRIVSGARCMSACNFIFMGGVVRTVEPGGAFGVHMFSDDMASVLMEDLRNPPKTVEEFNDRYPSRQIRAYQIEQKIAQLNKQNSATPITVAEYLHHPDIQGEIIDSRVKEIQQEAAQTAAVIASYLVEMRLPLRFLEQFSDISSDTIHVLTQQELRDLNIVN